MTIVEEKLMRAYATLVIAERMNLEDVPEKIRQEVEVEIANRTIEILSD